MNNPDDFFEVNNQVPFQPIKNINIQSLHLHEEQLKIRASMTLVGSPDSDSVDLVRTEKDVLWLIENLASTGQLPLLPRVDCENTLSHLINLISGSQPSKIKKQRLLKEKVLLRCLNLIVTICLNHLRVVGEHYQTPIFIFFHENFYLYQNPIYYKEEKVALSTKVGNYFWHKYAIFTGKGNNWQELQSSKKQILEQRQRLHEVTYKLYDYLHQLTKLQDQFISEKDKIRKRVNITQQLYLSFEMQLRYLDLLLEEAKQTAARAEQQRLQNQEIITAYGQHLKLEGQEARKASQKLLAQYVKVICQQENKLRIAPR